MATTRWLNNVTGSDANTGANPTNDPPGTGPKLTWDAAIQQITTVGDVLNVMSTGTAYDVAVTRNIGNAAALAGTDFGAGFGCKIQGVANNATGSPVFAKLRPTAAVSVIGVRENQNFVIIQGLHLDRSLGPVASSNFVNINDGGGGTAGPGLVQYCIDESSASRSGAFVRETAGGGNLAAWQVQYCLVKNPQTSAPFQWTASLGHQTIINNIVFDLGLAGSPTLVNFGGNDSDPGADHRIHHNTIVCRAGRVSFFQSLGMTPPGAHAAAQKHCHSNVFVQFTADASTDQFMLGSSSWEDIVWTGQRTIGWNVFVDAGGFAWSTNQPYSGPWDEDNSDVPSDTGQMWSTDVSDVAAGADPFNASGTAFNWNPQNAGYIIPLVGDYRLVQHRSAGKDASVPGAIPDAVVPPSSPPIFFPGTSGPLVSPNAPAYLFGGPDGINAAVHVMRNTELEAHHYFEGVREMVTRVGDGMIVVSTNVANAPLPLLINSRAFMLESDAPVTIKLNSHQVQLLAGGCIMIDGANLQTLTVTNPSTIRTATIRYIGAK